MAGAPAAGGVPSPSSPEISLTPVISTTPLPNSNTINNLIHPSSKTSSKWTDLFNRDSQKTYPPPHLNSAGIPVVKAPPSILLQNSEMWQDYMVCHFFGDPPPIRKIFSDLNRIWGKKGDIHVRQYTSRSCLIYIPHLPTRTWALQTGFWSAGMVNFIVAMWSPSATLSEQSINAAPVWLTLSQVPPQLWSEEGFALIASGVGTPIPPAKSGSNSPPSITSAKVRAIVPLTKGPLPSTVIVEDENGAQAEIEIQYSSLPPLCPICDQYGHMSHRCPARPRDTQRKSPKSTATGTDAPVPPATDVPSSPHRGTARSTKHQRRSHHIVSDNSELGFSSGPELASSTLAQSAPLPTQAHSSVQLAISPRKSSPPSTPAIGSGQAQTTSIKPKSLAHSKKAHSSSKRPSNPFLPLAHSTLNMGPLPAHENPSASDPLDEISPGPLHVAQNLGPSDHLICSGPDLTSSSEFPPLVPTFSPLAQSPVTMTPISTMASTSGKISRSPAASPVTQAPPSNSSSTPAVSETMQSSDPSLPPPSTSAVTATDPVAITAIDLEAKNLSPSATSNLISPHRLHLSPPPSATFTSLLLQQLEDHRPSIHEVLDEGETSDAVNSIVALEEGEISVDFRSAKSTKPKPNEHQSPFIDHASKKSTTKQHLRHFPKFPLSKRLLYNFP